LRELIQWTIIKNLGRCREIADGENSHLLRAVMSCCLVTLDSLVGWRLDQQKAENSTIFEEDIG